MSLLRFRSPFREPPQPRERMHEVAGRAVPLKIVENARARRLTLRIATGGQGLRVTVPPGVPDAEIQRFLERHQGWLEEKYRKYPPDALVRPGIRLPLRGKPHRIVHVEASRGLATATVLDGEPVLLVPGAIEQRPTSNRWSRPTRPPSEDAPRPSATRTRAAAGAPAPRTAFSPFPGAS
jgi:hypothetical protein